MNSSADSQSAPQTPEQFAEFLRKRVHEAIAASVHHASLSQQYLSLSQRFSAIAEQASSGNVSLTLQSMRQLEREAATGIAAAPIAAALSTTTKNKTHPAAVIPVPSANTVNAFPAVPDSAMNGVEFYSPPATFSLPETEATLKSMSASILTDPPTVSGSLSPAGRSSAATTLTPHRKRYRSVSVRSVLERARHARLETTDKVRVKARKSDLKPQLRSVSEDFTRELKQGSKPAFISLLLTGLILFVLALRQMEFFENVPVPPIIARISTTIEAVQESIPISPPAEEVPEEGLEQPVEEMIEEPEAESGPELIPVSDAIPDRKAPAASPPATLDHKTLATPGPQNVPEPGEIDNRSEAGRKLMVEKFGGSAASESAVGFALEWLAARQRINGTWDFIDVGPCTQQGSVNNPIGGTAYALLPFLAAGQTHKDGLYRKQIQAGLAFLTNIGIAVPAGYDLRGVVNKADDDTDPNYAYYVHGAATLALCEAYGMTKDRKLKSAAEGAVLFLVNSQDRHGGGWRYNPQQGGSTSATTIQIMALKAAEKAGIHIPEATWKGISFYLDSVSVDGEGRYGYEVEKKTYAISVTSMALLGRMYLGWGRNDGDMRAGIALIDKSTSTENYYTNYFATQVMKNWGGPEWKRWNNRVRENLISRQETEGPGKGSWTPRDRADYSRSGGRLLTTCLATLTLEVYYRNKPLLPEITVPVSPEDSCAAAHASPAER